MTTVRKKGYESGLADDVQSTLISRNVTIIGRRTSIRLEPEMWMALADISKRERCSIHDICSLVYVRKQANTSLTAAIRVFLMLYYRAASTEEGHIRAGHGDFNAMKRRAKISPHDDKILQKDFSAHRQGESQNENQKNI